MKKTLVFTLFLAACGGSHKAKPAEPAPAAPPAEAAPAPAEAPAPAPEAPKAEEKADTGAAAQAAAQAALAQQYDTGKKIFTEKACAKCHGDHGEGNPKNPAVIGEKALPEKAPAKAKLRKGITFKTAKDVLDFVKAKMPPKKPGSLTDDEAAAVTAWMLSESKVNIEKPLDATNAADVKLR